MKDYLPNILTSGIHFDLNSNVVDAHDNLLNILMFNKSRNNSIHSFNNGK